MYLTLVPSNPVKVFLRRYNSVCSVRVASRAHGTSLEYMYLFFYVTSESDLSHMRVSIMLEYSKKMEVVSCDFREGRQYRGKRLLENDDREGVLILCFHSSLFENNRVMIKCSLNQSEHINL